MSNICCLLDACTVINLIHIDEDDFLLKKIINLDLHINDMVFAEIKSNVYARLDNRELLKYSNKESLAASKKSIDQKLTFYRGKKNDNNDLLKELGNDFFDRIKSITNYTKRANGELCSAAYALYMSRCKEKKVFFYTDDLPAKEFFMPFFEYQQVGHIKDSVDFIILLYWLDENFTEKQLKNLLSELHSQYATDVVLLKQSLKNFEKERVDARYMKSNRDILENLKLLIYKLDKFEFQNINQIRVFFENKRAKNKEINDILDRFSTVFDLDCNSKSESFLDKIKKTSDQIESSKIHKLLDLCSS